MLLKSLSESISKCKRRQYGICYILDFKVYSHDYQNTSLFKESLCVAFSSFIKDFIFSLSCHLEQMLANFFLKGPGSMDLKPKVLLSQGLNSASVKQKQL
jgi:hypothetical protein